MLVKGVEDSLTLRNDYSRYSTKRAKAGGWESRELGSKISDGPAV